LLGKESVFLVEWEKMKTISAKKSDYKELMKLLSDFVGDKRYFKIGNDSFLKFLNNPNSYTYLLKDNKRLIGFITFSIRNVIRYPRPIAEIEELYIVPEYRGRGLSQKLIKSVLEKIKKIGCSRIYIGSEFKWKIAHKLYKNMGFEKVGYQFMRKLK
jgi:GNAT superfamily N-acetyltransferase